MDHLGETSDVSLTALENALKGILVLEQDEAKKIYNALMKGVRKAEAQLTVPRGTEEQIRKKFQRLLKKAEEDRMKTYKERKREFLLSGFIGEEVEIQVTEEELEACLVSSGEIRDRLLALWRFFVRYGEKSPEYYWANHIPKEEWDKQERMWKNLKRWGEENGIEILPPNEQYGGIALTSPLGKKWFPEIRKVSGNQVAQLCKKRIKKEVEEELRLSYEAGRKSPLLVETNDSLYSWSSTTRVVDEKGTVYGPQEVKKRALILRTKIKWVTAHTTSHVWNCVRMVKENKDLVVFVSPGLYRENVEIVVHSSFLKEVPVGMKGFHDII